jgi:hypothetical protein
MQEAMSCPGVACRCFATLILRYAQDDRVALPFVVTLSTFVSLSVNSAKGLAELTPIMLEFDIAFTTYYNDVTREVKSPWF